MMAANLRDDGGGGIPGDGGGNAEHA